MSTKEIHENHEPTPAKVRLTDGLGPAGRAKIDTLMKRCQIGVGGRHALDNAHSIMAECYGTLGRQQIEIERLREALTELRDRIKDHPAYADLTEEEEIETGGDTAELSYLARVADSALEA